MAKRKKQRSDIVIQGNQATWNLHHQGAIQGTYMGNFVFRCFLSPLQLLAASREYRELLGPFPDMATDNEKFLAYAMAQLKYRIISSPPFWTSTEEGMGDVPDYEVITRVMEAASDAEVMFREGKRKEKEDALNLAKRAAEKILNERPEESSEEEEDEKDEE